MPQEMSFHSRSEIDWHGHCSATRQRTRNERSTTPTKEHRLENIANDSRKRGASGGLALVHDVL